MGRIIINNKSDMLDEEAVTFVLSVMESGRISNNGKQFCYLTSSKRGKDEYHCVTDLRKNSDSFTIYKANSKNKQ